MRKFGYINSSSLSVLTDEIDELKNPKVRSYDLKKWSKQIREESPFCDCCGTQEELTVHHLYPKHFFPALALHPHNGVVLCKKHHLEYHKYWADTKNTSPVTYQHFKTLYGAKVAQKAYQQMMVDTKELRIEQSNRDKANHLEMMATMAVAAVTDAITEVT